MKKLLLVLVVLIVLVGAGYVGFIKYLESKYTQILDNLFALAQPTYQITYADLIVNPFKTAVTVEDIKVSKAEEQVAQFKKFTLSDLVSEGELLTQAHFDIVEFEIQSPNGKDPQKGSAVFDYAYDPELQAYSLNNLSVTNTEDKSELQIQQAIASNITKENERLTHFDLSIEHLKFFDHAHIPPKQVADTNISFAYDYDLTEQTSYIRNLVALPMTADGEKNKSTVELISWKQQLDTDNIPLMVQLNVRNFDFPRNITEQAPAGMIATLPTPERLQGDYGLRYDYNKEFKHAAFESGIMIKDLFSYYMALGFNNIDPTQLPDPQGRAQIVQTVILSNLEVRYQDVTLVKNLLAEFDAKLMPKPSLDQSTIPDTSNGEEKLTAKKVVKEQINSWLLQGKETPAEVQTFVDNLHRFVDNPNVLHIKMDPTKQMPLAQAIGLAVLGPNNLITTLGLTAQAE